MQLAFGKPGLFISEMFAKKIDDFALRFVGLLHIGYDINYSTCTEVREWVDARDRHL